MEAKVIFLLVCVLSGSTLTRAQFEDLTECLQSEDFMSNFATCLVSGIAGSVDTADLPTAQEVFGDYADVHGTGRKLQSFAGHERNLDLAPTKYILDLKMKEMGITNKGVNSVYHDIVSYANAWGAAGSTKDSLADKLRHLNLKKFVADEYIKRFTDHFTSVLEKALYLREYANNMKVLMENAHPTMEQIDERICDVIGLQPQTCDMINCLQGYTPTEFEDSIDWIQCFVSCDDLGPIAECSANMFMMDEVCSRVQWFSDVLVGIVVAALNRTMCDFKVETPADLSQPIELVEGGDSENMEFKTYVPPGVMCLGADPLNEPANLALIVVGNVFGFDVTCDVEMQITTANWLDDLLPYFPAVSDRSKCRAPNRASNQVAIGFHSATTNNSAVFKITDNNWNDTFVIPLLPVVDHKVDGQATVSFTMKLFVQGEIRGDTVKFPVVVNDTDPGEVDPPGPGIRINPVECYSMNDPHIMTFDGFYYNNFHQGAFHLYKHKEYPYEVQAIYQPCEVGNNNATCNCAVAVRSGDDVFVMDRCRRKCEGGPCEPVQKVVMFINGELTPGTRVFKMDGGLRHDVVLPHGTIIKIITSNDLLNVWIMPGSYDMEMTQGLCGTYDADTSDDLEMRDGSVYDGDGSGFAEQPKPFSQDWRVPSEELIFDGAESNGDSFSPLSACHCTHIVFSGASCECGRGTVTELCDLYMEGEYAENITAILHPSNYSSDNANYLDDIALDETYDPPVLNDKGWPGVWNETAAEAFCVNLLETSTNPIIPQCDDPTYEEAIIFCMQDIQLLDNTNWQLSTIDNAKFRCYNRLARDVSVRANIIAIYPNGSCINECLGRGDCIDGMCVCRDNYRGPDCRTPPDTGLILADKDTQICDSRSQVCNFATIMGAGFDSSVDMRCLIKNVSISAEGVDYLPKRKTMTWEHNMTVISMNQAVCPLPGNGSYEITVAYRIDETEEATGSQGVIARLMRHKRDLEVAMTTDGTTVTFIFITHDSMCFECDATGQSCKRKETDDYCWIDDACWAPGETKPDDPCRYCNNATSTVEWSMYETTPCVEQKAEEDQLAEEDRKDKILRGALGGCICAVVVIVVIIIFCVTRNKDKKTQMTETVLNGNNVMPRPGTVAYADGSYKSDAGFDNLAMLKDDGDLDSMSYDVLGQSLSEGIKHPLTRVDVLKREEINVQRHNSFGSESIRSGDSFRSTDETVKTAL